MPLVRRTLGTLVAFALGLVGCVKHAPRDTSALLGDVRVIGHRGAAGLAPENTFPAFEAARRLGVPIELDVTAASTGEIVVIHDDTLDRTTTGKGNVDETPWSVIAGLDAGSWYGPEQVGVGVPLLEDVLREFAPDVVVDVEIKSPRDGSSLTAEALGAAVAAVIERSGMVDRVFVTSFNPYVLAAVREANPAIIRGQLYGTFEDSDLSFVEKFVLKRLLLNGKAVPDLLVPEDAFLRPRYVRRMKKKGYRVVTWTVDDPDQMRQLYEWGVDAVITDRPDVAPGRSRSKGALALLPAKALP